MNRIEFPRVPFKGCGSPASSEQRFEERMLEVLDHDELRAQLSRNAAVDIRKEASPEIMFQGFHQCLERLAGEQNHRRR